MNIHWRIGKRRPNFTPICHIHTINVFIKLTGTYRYILYDNCISTVKFYHLLEHIILKKEKKYSKKLDFLPDLNRNWRFVQWTKVNKNPDYRFLPHVSRFRNRNYFDKEENMNYYYFSIKHFCFWTDSHVVKTCNMDFC